MRQASENQLQELGTESVDIPGTALRVGRVALGTWAMGGWMWGGTDDRESVATIRAALEQGINLIDTAPVYGFGVSEEIVGRAVAPAGLRSQAVIATKVGLEWRDGKVYRNATYTQLGTGNGYGLGVEFLHLILAGLWHEQNSSSMNAHRVGQVHVPGIASAGELVTYEIRGETEAQRRTCNPRVHWSRGSHR